MGNALLLERIAELNTAMENTAENISSVEFFKGRRIEKNTKVFVYFNLHKHVFSVKAEEGEHKGKVVMHLPILLMKDCEFVVSEAGRQKVLREQKKYFHAGIRGYLDLEPFVRDYPQLISYNPYHNETFIRKDTGEAIYHAGHVLLTDKKVWVAE